MSIRKFGTSDDHQVEVDKKDEQGVPADTIRRSAAREEFTAQDAADIINEDRE